MGRAAPARGGSCPLLASPAAMWAALRTSAALLASAVPGLCPSELANGAQDVL